MLYQGLLLPVLFLFIFTCFWIDQVLRSLVPDPMSQEPLVVENTPDPLAGEQVSLISSLTDEGAICLCCYLFENLLVIV